MITPYLLSDDDPNNALWLDPDLVEFVDHTPGTTARIGNRSFTRSAGGEWIETLASRRFTGQ